MHAGEGVTNSAMSPVNEGLLGERKHSELSFDVGIALGGEGSLGSENKDFTLMRDRIKLPERFRIYHSINAGCGTSL